MILRGTSEFRHTGLDVPLVGTYSVYRADKLALYQEPHNSNNKISPAKRIYSFSKSSCSWRLSRTRFVKVVLSFKSTLTLYLISRILWGRAARSKYVLGNREGQNLKGKLTSVTNKIPRRTSYTFLSCKFLLTIGRP